MHAQQCSLSFPNCLLFLQMNSTTNTTIGQVTLENRGLDFDGYFFWISVSALFGFILFFNVGFVLALSFLNRKFSFLIEWELQNFQNNICLFTS